MPGAILAVHIYQCIAEVFFQGLCNLYQVSAKDKFENMPEEEVRPEPLLTGYDLIAAGFQPGPHFKEWLTAVEDAQLEGAIRTKEEAMELVKAKVGM